MASDARKRQWFDLGAESFARERPGIYERPTYPCPICLDPFGIEALTDAVPEEKRLSVEHVPPESVGGYELLLTCTPCNNTAGTEVDAHAKRKEDVLAAMAGRADRPHRVVAWIGGVRLNATLHAMSGSYSIKVPTKNNRPGTNEVLRDTAKRGVEMTLRHEPFSELGAFISWLRSGYLALFAGNGYRLALDPAMQIVRQQIRKPATQLIPFSEVPDDVPLTTRRLVRVQAPEWHAGYLVQFGRYLVHFPGPGDTDFYSRLAENVKDGWPELECEDFGWPTEATFGLSADQNPGTPTRLG